MSHSRRPRHPEFKRLALASLIAAAFGAQAQTAPTAQTAQTAQTAGDAAGSDGAATHDAPQRVEVTGSYIKRVSVEGPSPIQVISRAEIDASGATTAAELLDKVVANDNAGGQYRTNDTNNTVVGGSGVSLRGLGPNSTLVLLNGRRVAFYGFSDQSVFVDLNTIPLSAVERVEILKDGASAIYGSDALAGVVNFILRDNYSGVDARYTAGKSLSYGDHDTQTLTVTAGGRSGRLSTLGILEAYTASPVMVSERQGGRQADRTAAAIAAGYDTPSLHEGEAIGGNFPATSSSSGNWYSNNPNDGGNQEYYAAGACNAPNVSYTGTYNGYAARGMCLDPVTDRFNTLWPRTRKLSGFGRATYEFSESLRAFGELSLSRNEERYDYWPVFKNDYYDVTTTPHFPLDQAPAGWGYYARLYDELGSKVRDVTSRSVRAVIGLEGEGAGWDWTVAYTHSGNHTNYLGTNYIRNDVWYQGVADGSIDPFSRLTAANIDALHTTTTRDGRSSFDLLDATASREVGRLRGSPVMLAVGTNLRAEKMSDGADAATNAGLVENAAIRLPISASRNAQALYAELSLPLLQTLEAQLALRYDRFAGVGSSVNPKIAMKWTPAPSFALRGSYTTGFRAPSLAEMHGGTRYFVNCDPNTAPVCPAYSQVWGNEVTVTFGDSPDLQPEKSRSTNLGLVWEPFKHHSLSVDAWSITRTNQVYAPSIGNPADAAYFTLVSPASNAAPAAFNATYVNLGQTQVQGVDIGLQNRWSLGEHGTLGLSVTSTNMSRYDVESRGVTTPQAGTYGFPKWRHHAELNWAVGNWSHWLGVNYRGEFQQAVPGPNGSPIMVGSFTTVDLSTSYRGLGHGLTLSAGIGNLLGTAPPFDRLGRLGTLYEDNSDRRTGYLTVDYKFL